MVATVTRMKETVRTVHYFERDGYYAKNDPARPTAKSLPLRYEARKRAGLEDVRLYDLRHTFASHAVMQGVPLPVVARPLGHSATMRVALKPQGSPSVDKRDERRSFTLFMPQRRCARFQGTERATMGGIS